MSVCLLGDQKVNLIKNEKRETNAVERRVGNSLQAPLVQLRERNMFLGMKNNPLNQSMERTHPLSKKSVNSKLEVVIEQGES